MPSIPGLSSAPVDLLAAAPTAASTAELARRRDIRNTAQNFEASFLSTMFASMFQGTDVSEPFGGGEGETTWKSFLTEAMAKQVTRAGGIGLSDVINREMLKLQGFEENPSSPAPQTTPPTASSN